MKEFVVYYKTGKNNMRQEIQMESLLNNKPIKGQDVWNYVINLLDTKHSMNTITSIKIISKANDFYSKGADLE